MLSSTLKPKPCDFCKALFTPARLMQNVCSPRCALRKVRAEKVEERAKVTTRREKLKTNGQRKAEAQAAVNAYVRMRDAHEPCISCDRFHQGEWHAGHYRSRGSAPHLALDPRNLHRQCAPCNLHLHGNLIAYRAGLIRRHGVAFVEALESDNTPRHYSPDDLTAIRAEYREKTKQLKKDSA